MGQVDENNRLNFYEGNVRIVDPKGDEYALFDCHDYADYIGEWVEPWTYIRLTYLRKIGWKGLDEGGGTSLYRVGPLARLNVADGMLTPFAHKEFETMFAVLGSKPAHHTLAYHWARLIEALQAAEHMQRIANDKRQRRQPNNDYSKNVICANDASRGGGNMSTHLFGDIHGARRPLW
jgi:F420-non-reducing hydrogenase large subunit